jgi:hypothetical protein
VNYERVFLTDHQAGGFRERSRTDWRKKRRLIFPKPMPVPVGGLEQSIERLAAHAVTAASNMGNLGTYIGTWAIKK